MGGVSRSNFSIIQGEVNVGSRLAAAACRLLALLRTCQVSLFICWPCCPVHLLALLPTCPTAFTCAGAGEDGGPAGVFAGNVTTANNGGFASVRCRNIEPPLDLSGECQWAQLWWLLLYGGC